ncbi:MAG: TlpA family protein disulfide reductase [Candidatus Hydrogenedentes bacterium]|nr:TlpA family protein disulfide reductase [Candidatus Hydrogenedentota bacterium]
MKATAKSFAAGCLLGTFVCPLLLFGAFGVSYYFFRDAIIGKAAGLREESLRVPPISAGQQADYAWTVKDLEGNTVSLETAKGKTLFLHYWSPECAICLAEIPSVNALYKQVKDLPIAFFCVTANPNGIDLNATAREYGLDFPIYLFDGDRPEVFASSSAPLTWIVTPSGAVAFKHESGAKWDDPATVAFLRSLAEMPGNPGELISEPLEN